MIMYTEKAIERLNNINWEDVGKNGEEKDIELGLEFIKKMALFCKKNQIRREYEKKSVKRLNKRSSMIK